MKKKSILFLTTVLGVIAIDQWSKYVVRTSWELQNMDIIPGWLSFHYTKNPGMALGIDFLDTFYVSLFALIATFVILGYIIKNIKSANVPFMFLMGLIVGGAIGNLLDRIFMGYVGGYGGFLEGHVVDFIHFTLKINDWPVFPYIFNMADVAISCAVIMFILFNKKFFPEEKLVDQDLNLTDESTYSQENDIQDSTTESKVN
ncbi:MAG TPA: signal peptidase II [Bacteroidetes bacterium]|nr:signal peptidase II [Bacteroidota bacterium]